MSRVGFLEFGNKNVQAVIFEKANYPKLESCKRWLKQRHLYPSNYRPQSNGDEWVFKIHNENKYKYKYVYKHKDGVTQIIGELRKPPVKNKSIYGLA